MTNTFNTNIAPGRRPGAVTAAAVLAFVFGGLGILCSSLCALGFLLLATSSNHSAQVPPVLVAIIFAVLLLRLSMSALFIWGGVAALNGRRRILVVISVIDVSLLLLGLALSLAGGTTMVGDRFVAELPALIFVVPVLILILQPSSTAFFRAQSGKTERRPGEPLPSIAVADALLDERRDLTALGTTSP